MIVKYDAEVDVLTIVFKAAPIMESDEAEPGIVFDYDKDGNVLGIEILDASLKIDDPQTMEYAVAPSKSGALA